MISLRGLSPLPHDAFAQKPQIGQTLKMTSSEGVRYWKHRRTTSPTFIAFLGTTVKRWRSTFLGNAMRRIKREKKKGNNADRKRKEAKRQKLVRRSDWLDLGKCSESDAWNSGTSRQKTRQHSRRDCNARRHSTRKRMCVCQVHLADA